MEFGLSRSLGPNLHCYAQMAALQGPYMCEATIGIGLFSECHFNTDAQLKPVMGFDFFVAGGA